jgi:rRNA maturation endonuclease Nob1
MSWECPCGFTNSNATIKCLGCGLTLEEMRENLERTSTEEQVEQKIKEIEKKPETDELETYEIAIIAICLILLIVIGSLTRVEFEIGPGFTPIAKTSRAFIVLVVIGLIYIILRRVFNWGKYCAKCFKKAHPFVSRCQYCGGDLKIIY